MQAAAQEPWAILAAIPKVVEYEDAERILPPGTDISVVRNELPQASVVNVVPHISLPACLALYPYVAAADSSGLLLVFGTHPIGCNSAMLNYHICDARTGEAVSLPKQTRPMRFYGANVGLIVKGDGYMVAELLSGCDGTGGATLLSYKVGECGKWRERELTCSPPLPPDWYPEGVVSHGGMLWWVDLSYGLLACDPFVEEPNLLYVPLPQPQVADDLPAVDPPNRGARRCVKVSGGRLRYVQIHGKPSAPVVSMWGLAESPGEWEWNAERSVSLAELWVDQSYVDTVLPSTVPALALLHPTDPGKVYFFLISCIFVVDLRLRKLVGFDKFEMLDPPRELGQKRSSHFVHAWKYDPSSTRSEFVSACFRQEKAIAAKSRFSDPVTPQTVERLKKIWESVAREEEEDRQRLLVLHEQMLRRFVPDRQEEDRQLWREQMLRRFMPILKRCYIQAKSVWNE